MEYLTCEQVAEIVHCSIFHVREEVKGGRLKAYKPGKGYLFVREDVDAWVKASEAKVAKEETNE